MTAELLRETVPNGHLWWRIADPQWVDSLDPGFAREQGVRARSARSRHGAGREFAWFPVSVRSVVRRVRTLTFLAWFWG